jgi:hypothetical protein
MVEKEGVKNVMHPLRTALSGEKKSLDPFSLLTILGKTESTERIHSVLEKMNA